MKFLDLYYTVQEMKSNDIYEVTLDGAACRMTLKELKEKRPDSEVLKVSIRKKKISII